VNQDVQGSPEALGSNWLTGNRLDPPSWCGAARTLLTVYFGAPSMFITLWFGFDYGTNPPLGTLII
jgi:hypothetical protein